MPLPSAYTPCGKSNAAAHAGSRTLDGAKEFDRRGRAILVSGVALALRIIVQHADRRRIEIIELALSCCADEGEQSAGCQQERERKHDRDHAHDRPPVGCLAANGLDLRQMATTVSELAGMMIAASSGLISPAIAKLAAIAL